jgi:hypothetical protein
MGIQESLLRVTSFKAAKQFIGNKQKGWMSSCLGFLRHSKTFYPVRRARPARLLRAGQPRPPGA